MKYLPFLFVLLLCACIKREAEEWPAECQSLRYLHTLVVPVSISLHQIEYQLGDTIRFGMSFLDSMYDLATGKKHPVKDFPFRPVSYLFRFTEEGHESGYLVNHITIDSIYHPVYFNSIRDVVAFKARPTYIGNRYHFEAELILQKKGVYVLALMDQYMQFGTITDPLQDIIDTMSLGGERCFQTAFSLFNLISSGEDHLDFFQDELIYLDEEVFNGAISVDQSFEVLDDTVIIRERERFLGTAGLVSLETNGYFAFEVVE